jgi:hypothetical protein
MPSDSLAKQLPLGIYELQHKADFRGGSTERKKEKLEKGREY